MPRVAPTSATYAALFGSTGAAVMSAFHQLPGGKSGSGWGSAPPRCGDCARAAEERARRRRVRWNMKRILRASHETFVPLVTAGSDLPNEIGLRYNAQLQISNGRNPAGSAGPPLPHHHKEGPAREADPSDRRTLPSR